MDSTDFEQLFRIVLKNTDDGILLFRAVRDQDQVITDFAFWQYNAQALAFIQKEAADITGKKLSQVFPGNWDTGLFASYCDVVEHQRPFRTEQFYDRDGLQHWFKIIASATQDYLLVTFRDISEYKRIIVEKERSENLHLSLISTLPGVDVALINKDLEIIVAKGTPFSAFGYPETVHPKEALFRQLPHDTSERIMALCHEGLAGKSLKTEITTDDVRYQISLVPIKDSEGIFGVLLMSVDISLFNVSEGDLRNQLYELESAKESLEQFAYVASHDLQEPLRKIRAFGDRLTAKYADQLQGSGQDYIARMQNAAERMQQLIDDLLQYSRVGRLQNEPQAVDLNEVIDDVLKNMLTQTDDGQASISVQRLPTIVGEPWQIKQVFQNLISNAIKFRRMEVLPQIHISAREMPLDELQRTQRTILPDTAYHEITVADNGIGFDEKYLDRIFDIFQRLHGRTKYSGTGIGLAICRKIIDHHFGTISAQSTPGEGARFSVVLPEKQPIAS